MGLQEPLIRQEDQQPYRDGHERIFGKQTPAYLKKASETTMDTSKVITINYDFGTGKELPYLTGLEAITRDQSFTTNCIVFFSFTQIFERGYDDVKIVKQDGSYISAKELLDNTGEYTDREIRRAHNLQKLFCAGALKWKKDQDESN